MLLGNGDLRPFAGAKVDRSSPLPAILAMGFTVVIAPGVVRSRRRR